MVVVVSKFPNEEKIILTMHLRANEVISKMKRIIQEVKV